MGALPMLGVVERIFGDCFTPGGPFHSPSDSDWSWILSVAPLSRHDLVSRMFLLPLRYLFPALLVLHVGGSNAFLIQCPGGVILLDLPAYLKLPFAFSLEQAHHHAHVLVCCET